MLISGSEPSGEMSNRAAKLEAILNTAVAAIVTIDGMGVIDSINPATTTLFGYPADELIGRNVKMLMPEPYGLEHDGYLANYLSSGVKKIIGIGREVLGRRKDGSTFPIHLAVSEFESRGQRHFAGIITDLSIRRAAQEALKESDRRLIQAQKMEAVGQLAGGLAHDFNNLLTIILGNLELVVPQLADEHLRAQLQRVLDAAASGSELTRRLLTFSRQSPLDPQTIDMNAWVVQTSELLRRTLGEHIILSTTLAPTVWEVQADPAQIANALTNLALNARDAMANGGRLSISTRNFKIDAEQIAAGLEACPGDYVAVAVSDTGPGIPPEIRSRVFEPFFTTKPRGRGTGLGLAMVYGLVKQSGGHVMLNSEVGHGTTVTLYLPRATGSAVQAKSVEAAHPPATASGGVVLLVEDDAGVRQLNIERLKTLGFEVIEASTGAQALELIKAGLRPDLVFSDMIMPGGVSGRDLVEQAKLIVPAMRFLLTSGYAEEMVNAEGHPTLAVKVLQKPYRMAEFAAAVREALGTRQ
jgi:PAS domain S-box-containing protein